MKGMYIIEASGRARCKLCGEIIKKGQKAVKAWAWRMEMQCHRNPASCRRKKE